MGSGAICTLLTTQELHKVAKLQQLNLKQQLKRSWWRTKLPTAKHTNCKLWGNCVPACVIEYDTSLWWDSHNDTTLPCSFHTVSSGFSACSLLTYRIFLAKNVLSDEKLVLGDGRCTLRAAAKVYLDLVHGPKIMGDAFLSRDVINLHCPLWNEWFHDHFLSTIITVGFYFNDLIYFLICFYVFITDM